MAQVYGFVTDEWAAKLPGVRATIKSNTERIGAKAKALLAQHRDEGDAEIKIEYGSLDGFVVLDDAGGDRAAAAIEFGSVRWSKDGKPVVVPGLYILRRAAR